MRKQVPTGLLMQVSRNLIGILVFALFTVFSVEARIQGDSIQRVEPAFWWTGMQHPQLQILLYGEEIGDFRPAIKYPGVTLRRVTRVQNENYLFLHLHIADSAKPGTFDIRLFDEDKLQETVAYELRSRKEGSARREGFNPGDVIYLITPDRFANGDPSNDAVNGMIEKPDRDNPDGRHGGDIAGIKQHLSDIKEMGFTAIWLNPLLENNQPKYSYHGYSTTDYYQVDPRFGSNREYRQMVQKAKEMGIKVIMDQIVNHIGSEHWWVDDPPTDNWIHFGGDYVQTNHKHVTIQDPYASDYDRRHFVDGWFVRSMPDLNHDNPLLATYLIQNSIWWIEYAGISGIRMDTYPYSGPEFMAEWSCRVMKEYPHFTIVGEEWNWNPAIVSYWQKGKDHPNNYGSCLPSLMDFPLQRALMQGLTQEEGRTTGWVQTYEMLSKDFLYPDPMNLVIFPDNHDMDRFYTQIDRVFGLWKLGIAYTLTMRGIPQLYYGTEILMSNPDGTGHGVIRSDYPGGWPGDEVNAFTGKGLTARQDSAKAFLSKLANWRKQANVIHSGQLTHFVPQNGVYVYFRYNSSHKVMVILNKNDQKTTLSQDRFAKYLSPGSEAKDIITGKLYELNPSGSLAIPSKSPMILEFK